MQIPNQGNAPQHNATQHQKEHTLILYCTQHIMTGARDHKLNFYAYIPYYIDTYNPSYLYS